MNQSTASRRLFVVLNTLVLAFASFIALVPVIHMLAISLSSNVAALSGKVTLWPVGLNLDSYKELISDSGFIPALGITLVRVVTGTSLNVFLCVLTAYPLSRENEQFRLRTVFAWFFAFTMFFGGGLVPSYMVISKLGLKNTLWSLILPGALPVYYTVMMVNFFRGVPKSLEEAARLDGASHFTTLVRVYLPLSLPSLATILLFTAISHWNSWFDGYIYMSKPANYPLSTYLYAMVEKTKTLGTLTNISAAEMLQMSNIGEKTLRMAQLFLGVLPIMCVYPFLQRFFIKGIVLGAVKE